MSTDLTPVKAELVSAHAGVIYRVVSNVRTPIVKKLTSMGWKTKDIAELLGISSKTVLEMKNRELRGRPVLLPVEDEQIEDE